MNFIILPLPADGDVVTLRSEDLRHHGAARSPEGEAAAHRAAAGRAWPGASRDGQGHQPHRRGGEGAERPQGATRAGMRRRRRNENLWRKCSNVDVPAAHSTWRRMRRTSSRSEPFWPPRRKTNRNWPISSKRRRGTFQFIRWKTVPEGNPFEIQQQKVSSIPEPFVTFSHTLSQIAKSGKWRKLLWFVFLTIHSKSKIMVWKRKKQEAAESILFSSLEKELTLEGNKQIWTVWHLLSWSWESKNFVCNVSKRQVESGNVNRSRLDHVNTMWPAEESKRTRKFRNLRTLFCLLNVEIIWCWCVLQEGGGSSVQSGGGIHHQRRPGGSNQHYWSIETISIMGSNVHNQ